MAKLLRDIENLILPSDAPREKWERSMLPRQIENLSALPKQIEALSAKRDHFKAVVDQVGTELGHATGRAVENVEDILPELTAVTSSLKGRQGEQEILRKISRMIDLTGADTLNFQDLPTKIDQHIRKIVNDTSYETKSNREILKSISRTVDPTSSEGSLFVELPTKVERYIHQILEESQVKNKSNWEILKRISYIIDPTHSDPSNFEDLPNKVGLLVGNSASKQDNVRDGIAPDPERAEDKDAIEVGKRMKWFTDRIDALRKKEEQMSNELKDTQKKLTQASDEVGLLRNLVRTLEGKLEEADRRYQTVSTAKQVEIQEFQASEKNLRAHQQILEGELEEAKRRYQKTEQGLKESHANDLKHAESIKKKAIAELEDAHSEQIQTLTNQHAKKLETQKTAIARQHEGEMIAERKKHGSEKQRIETHLRGLHDDALRKQKEAENARASIAKELHERETSLLEARKQIKSQDVKLREHQQSLSEAGKQIKAHDSQLIALEKRHSEKLTEQTILHSKALTEVESEKKEQLEILRQEHNRQLIQNQTKWEADKIELERALQLERATSEEINEEEAQKHKVSIEKLETELLEVKTRTAEKVEAEAQKYKGTIEKLELGRKKLLSMLLKQEDYPGLSDQEIVRGVSSKTGKIAIVGFGSMVSQVTTFSEWEWREDRNIWSKDTMTALVGTKQRRLKKLILGDAIWTTLYQWIFCSPFRVLGKEGERLEADWNKLFPSGMFPCEIGLRVH